MSIMAAKVMDILSTSTSLILLGAVLTIVGTTLFSFGMLFKGEERAQSLEEKREKDFSIVDATIDLSFSFDKEDFLRGNPTGLPQGKFIVIFNIRLPNSDKIVGRFNIFGSWVQDLPGFYDGGDNLVSFSSAGLDLSMMRMHPRIEFIDSSIRLLKSGQKYHLDFVGFPNPPTFKLKPMKLIVRTKYGENHLADRFDGTHESNWHTVTLVVP